MTLKIQNKKSDKKAEAKASKKGKSAKDDAKSEKMRKLDQALSSIEKQFGKGSIRKMGDGSAVMMPSISTGCLSLDLALGIGGVPKGRIIEIFGPESSGKTTLTLQIAAECQRKGGTVAFIDAEHAMDTQYAKALGVNIDECIMSQPDSAEEAMQVAEMLVESEAVDLLIVDSVAALVPRAEIEGDMGDSHVGVVARLMGQALRKMTRTVAKTNCTAIFINQLRMKIGVKFGSPETTPGGNALKFFASVRIDIRRIGAIKDADTHIGNRTKITMKKNKVAPPFASTEVDIMYGGGISREGDLLDMAAIDKVVDKAGAWYSYGDMKLGQGRENSKKTLAENPDLFNEIREAVILKRAPDKAGVFGVKPPKEPKAESKDDKKEPEVVEA